MFTLTSEAVLRSAARLNIATPLRRRNVDIYTKWGTDIEYWLENSLPIGPGESQDSYPPAAYQNQTTAFILGGKRLNVEGHGYGTFDGNGQAWYDFVDGQSNYPSETPLPFVLQWIYYPY